MNHQINNTVVFSKMDKTKQNWYVWLRGRVDDFRKMHPDDKRTDVQLCESLMEHYVKSGLVKKKNSKYQIPELKYD